MDTNNPKQKVSEVDKVVPPENLEDTWGQAYSTGPDDYNRHTAALDSFESADDVKSYIATQMGKLAANVDDFNHAIKTFHETEGNEYVSSVVNDCQQFHSTQIELKEFSDEVSAYITDLCDDGVECGRLKQLANAYAITQLYDIDPDIELEEVLDFDIDAYVDQLFETSVAVSSEVLKTSDESDASDASDESDASDASDESDASDAS